MTPANRFRVVILTVAIGIPAAALFGQSTTPTTPTTGTGTGTSTGTGRGGAPTPTTTTPIPNNTQQQQQQQQTNMPQPIFVSGRVMLEDGTPPSEPVVIERVCGGNPHSEGYTDSKGYFSFELGAAFNSVLRDASESSLSDMGSGFGTPSLAGQNSTGRNPSMGSFGGNDNRFINCELRARLAGYRSQTVSLAMRRALDNPDVGVILLHRLSPTEGNTISASSLAAPKDARKAYEKAIDSVKKRKFEDAQKYLEKAVEVYPGYAVAWCELGRIRLAQGHRDIARKSFDEAVKSDPKYVEPYVQISIMEVQDQHWQQVVDITDQIVKLDSFDYPQAYFFNAVAQYNLRNFEAAEKSVRQAERLDTRHAFPKASHLLGVLLAQKQDYEGAAEHFRSYLKFAPSANDVPAVRSQLEQIEKLSAQAKQQ